jgi:hypothetical protein
LTLLAADSEDPRMPRHRVLAALSVGVLAATVVSVAPAHAATDWRTRLTYQDARAQICADVAADGTATVLLRMNNRRGELKVKTLISSVRADGRPDRTLKLSPWAEAGEVSKPAAYDGLRADDLFFVEISQRFDEGAGIVKTSDEPFLVSAQAPCSQ